MSERRVNHLLHLGVMPAVYTAFTLMQFWYLWTPIEGAAATWKYDPQHAYWGDLAFAVRAFLDGHLGIWNPYDRGGFPIYGDPQPGLLYPPNWPLYGWGMLVGQADYALVEVKVIAHWIFGAVGMHLFARQRRVPEPACYVGGVLFAFTSPAIRYGGSTLNWSFAWFPWVLLATDAFARRPDRRRAILLGTCVAMTLLAGAPASFLYMLIVAIPFGIYALWDRLRTDLRATALAVVGAAAVAGLWLLPLLLANFEQIAESVRSTRDLNFITGSPFRPAHMLNMFVPRLGGENIYYGVFSLAAFGALAGAHRRSPARLFLVITLVGLILSLGKNTEVLASFASSVPPVTFFRWAHRYLYVTNVAVAVGAALGVGYLISLEDEDRRRALGRALTIVGLLITTVLGIAWAVSIGAAEKLFTVKNDALAMGLISAALSTWMLRALCRAQGRRRAMYAWGAAALIAADIWVANAGAHRAVPGLSPKPAVTNRDHLLSGRPGIDDGSVRFYDRGLVRFRPGSRLGVRDFGGYEDDPLGLSRYRDFFDQVVRTPKVMGHANVRYYYHGDRRPPLRVNRKSEFKRLDKDIYEVAEYAPHAFYVARPQVVATRDDAFAALAKLTPGSDAVVEVESGREGEVPLGPDGADAVPGRVVVFEPERVVVEIETPGPGLVVVTEAYYPAWEATLDGQPVEILPANGMFRGVPVPTAGVHRIEMTLVPLRFYMPLPGFALAVGLSLWALVGVIRRREPTEPDASRSAPPDGDDSEDSENGEGASQEGADEGEMGADQDEAAREAG